MQTVDEHVHEWATFPGGRGCMTCPAWEHALTRTEIVDELPTRLIPRPAPATYGEPVGEDDAVLETMNELVTIARPDISWRELEETAVRIVERLSGQ